MPDDERLMIEFGLQSPESITSCFACAGDIGQKLIVKIPRLATVAQIIGGMATVDGSAVIQTPKTNDAKVLMGSTLVRVAIHWDYLSRQGLLAAAIVAEMRRSLPSLSAEMIGALHRLPSEDCDDADEFEIHLNDLEEGMVLASDVVTTTGTMLIRKGRRINMAIVERLRHFPSGADGLEPIRVRRGSLKSPADLMLS